MKAPMLLPNKKSQLSPATKPKKKSKKKSKSFTKNPRKKSFNPKKWQTNSV